MANEIQRPQMGDALPALSVAVSEPDPVSVADAAPRQPPSGLSRYVAALLRYKWMILLIALAGSAAAVFLSRQVRPQYSSEATIWVENGSGARGPIQPDELLPQTGWVDLVRSFQVIDNVVREQRLYLQYDPRDEGVLKDLQLGTAYHPSDYVLEVSKNGRAFTLTASDGGTVDQGAPGDSIGRRMGLLWSPPARSLRPGRKVVFSLVAPRDAARKLLQGLVVTLPMQSNFLRMSLTGENPERTAAIVNAVADRFLKVSAELKAAKMTEVSRILAEQLGAAQRSLQEAEAQLQAYRVENATKPSEVNIAPIARSSGPVAAGSGADAAFSRFFLMKVQREELVRDEESIQRALTAGPDGGPAVDALAVIPAAAQSPELKQALDELTQKRAALRAALQQYTEAMPAVKRAREELTSLERSTIPRLAAATISALELRKAAIDSTIANSTSELRAIPPRMIDEARLQRHVAITEQLSNSLQTRYEEARLAAETAIPDVRVLDRAAASQRPNRNNRLQILMTGIMGSLGAAVLLALLLDRFDRRVRYPEEVTYQMGLPILGVLPQLRGKDRKSDDDVTQAVESLRTIRLNVLHAYGAAGPTVFTVTSPGSSEGKSFVTSNLALAFADQGYRTLVIDGDIRRGSIHHLFQLVRKPGLTDLLDNKATLGQVLRQTSHERVDCIPSGSRLTRGPELLATPAMRQLLTQLRSDYDAILVDSPPLSAGVDPFVLATVTGSLLLVIRTGQTERALTRMHLDALSRVATRVLGVVLNGTRESPVYRYYRYLPGYDAAAEEEPKQLQPAG